jgi:hypothetical protein
LRSAPSGDMFITIDNAAGKITAVPSPCSLRIAIRNPPLVASPAPSDAAGEHGQAQHQDRPAPEQVGGPASQQQEAAEGDPVGGHHPLQVRFGDVKFAADRRQRDVDDREIDDRHEERDGQHGERAPAVYLGYRLCGHRLPFLVSAS